MTRSSILLYVALLLLVAVTSALPTPSAYTRRYGRHIARPAAPSPNRVERGSKQAVEMSRLVRQRAAQRAAKRRQPSANSPHANRRRAIMALKIRSSAAKTKSITPTQSTTLVKNLFRAAFSSIAYIRNFFGDECFEIGKIGSTRYHKLKVGNHDDARLYVDWLEKGIFDALKHRYLNVVLLEVYALGGTGSNVANQDSSTNPQLGDLLEVYSFNVTYGKEGAQFRLSSNAIADQDAIGCKEKIKQTTAELLRTLVQLTKTVRPLPPDHFISMKLMYTQNTPVDYEPPLFSKADGSNPTWFDDSPLHERAGRVSTPYHRLGMSIRVRATSANKGFNVLETGMSEASHKSQAEPAADPMPVDSATPAQVDNAQHDMEDVEAAIIVDVGSSRANSGRVRPTSDRHVVKDTQETPHSDKQMDIPARLPLQSNRRASKRLQRASQESDDHSQMTVRTSTRKRRKMSQVTFGIDHRQVKRQ